MIAEARASRGGGQVNQRGDRIIVNPIAFPCQPYAKISVSICYDAFIPTAHLRQHSPPNREVARMNATNRSDRLQKLDGSPVCLHLGCKLVEPVRYRIQCLSSRLRGWPYDRVYGCVKVMSKMMFNELMRQDNVIVEI